MRYFAGSEEHPMPNAHALIDTIQTLSPDPIAEIEHFVDFITADEQERSLLRAGATASTPPFAGI